MPFVLLILFVSVYQDLCAQKLQKQMAADQEQIELLSRRVQELRHGLAAATDFARLDPGVRGRGLQPARGEQVLAAATGPAAADEPAADLAGRLVTGLVEFLGPPAAQAEAHGLERSEGGEHAAPRPGLESDGGRTR